jgi:branched-chain amino acid transport system substrate-binding protein
VRKLIVCGIGLIAALALTVPGALGGATQTPGVTAKSITIGGTFPLTGPAASYAPIPLGMKAYFSYVNARKGPDKKRGVMGRQIVFKYYDDGYNPANTAQLTRRLVEQDKVFATVGGLGTEPQLAVRSYLNEQKVPQVFVSTGATEFGSQWREFPWTIGWQPDYIAEGRLYGLHAKANNAGKKIGVIYQNDDYGKDYLYGFRAALGKKYADANVVAQEAVEPTATSAASQITRIKAAGAQILAVFQLPTPTVRSIATAKALGLNLDQIYMNNVAAVKPATDGMVASAGAAYVNGLITIQYAKDPQDPKWANDPGVKLYRTIISKYGGGEGRCVRPGAVQGRPQPHPPGADERAPEPEHEELVPASGHGDEDVEDRPLRDQPDAARAAQLDDEALRTVRQADRGSPALGAFRLP